jgi:hypothetical protein
MRRSKGHLMSQPVFASLQVLSYAEEQGTPDDTVRLLVSWPLVSLELTYLREELPHVQV